MWLAPASDSLCRGFPFIVHGAKQHIPVRADEAPAHLAFTPVPHCLAPFRADRSICLMPLPWPWCITSDSLVPKSCLTLATPWTAARQAPLSMGFPRQEYWSGLTFPSPGDFPNPGVKRTSLAWQVDSLSLSHRGSPIYHVKWSCSVVSDSLRPSQAPLSMGFFQARVLEWVAISFSRGSSRPRDWTRVSRTAGRGIYCLSKPSCA